MNYRIIGAAVGLMAGLVSFAHIADAQSQPAGQQVFRQRCAACHSVGKTGKSAIGPNLGGVVGRKAASTAFGYSPALKNSKLTWTKDNLDQFLAGPGKKVPGTRMVVSIPDPKQRAAIIDYLSTN